MLITQNSSNSNTRVLYTFFTNFVSLSIINLELKVSFYQADNDYVKIV